MPVNMCIAEQTEARALGMTAIQGIFIVSAAALILCTIVLLLEIVHNKMKQTKVVPKQTTLSNAEKPSTDEEMKGKEGVKLNAYRQEDSFARNATNNQKTTQTSRNEIGNMPEVTE